MMGSGLPAKRTRGVTHTAILGAGAHNTANASATISVFARIVQIHHNGKANAFYMYVAIGNSANIVIILCFRKNKLN